MTLAHGATGPEAAWQTWHADPALIVIFVLTIAAYLLGLTRLRGRASRVSRRRVWAGVVGVVAAMVALGGPVDAAAYDLFAAHMVQHLMLILVVAPLVVAAQPLRVIGGAAPVSLRRTTVRWGNGSFGGAVRSPLAAGLVMAAALSAWHIPALYGAALRSPAVHIGEHATFLVAAVAFWGIVLGRRPAGTRAALTFGVFLFSGALGALLTFSTSSFYPAHGGGPTAWGISPLVDQQLAGVIMWIPSGAIYVIAFAALFIAWMRRLEARMPSRPESVRSVVDG